jgi:galactokinase/mevalonate kinase-like predicted kinase
MPASIGRITSSTFRMKKRCNSWSRCSIWRHWDPRTADFAVLSNTRIDRAGAKALAEATDACWQAILARDAAGFGAAVRASFEAQIAMFPHMVTPSILEMIDAHREQALGWKLSGAGGGGYVILVAAQPIEYAIRTYARRQLG